MPCQVGRRRRRLPWLVLPWVVAVALGAGAQEPPEGYYAFVESPNADPPRVRRPPYMQADRDCPGIHAPPTSKSLNNLCGDLNKGYIPRNPMGQNVLGSPYPFELLKNKTLQFLSKTLPILKADESLPKVAKYYQEPPASYHVSQNTLSTGYERPQRRRREAPAAETAAEAEMAAEAEAEAEGPKEETAEAAAPAEETQKEPAAAPPVLAGAGAGPRPEARSLDEAREGRKFCENGGGIMCMIYKAFSGESMNSGIERREDSDAIEYRREVPPPPPPPVHLPPTPCPAKVEYATPVFAKNYQGVWRYVVQIPYEGYFTQTLEVTRCLQSRCHYMDGGCLSSPRWVSLLVAEIFYPDTYLPAAGPGARWPAYRNPVAADSPPPVQDFQNYQQYLHKRAGAAPEATGSSTTAPPESLHIVME
ncbi:hypothetical protein R5R35_013959 [Gryllus longicercus]|uniref:Uncharacterized protein n=1 Tax=Gryllus longicercus TaxID=2509291 RepID=A0AAN9VE05_9ORTH